jgi:hypothetical protein
MPESELEKNKADFIVSVTKSIVGIVPYAGGFLTELIENIIPNQRIDRLVKYCEILNQKLSDLSNERISEYLKNEECIDLFEEGFFQASRAQTNERRAQIASVVRKGLDNDSIAYSESKYILKLLQELNEQELIWLRFYNVRGMNDSEKFRKKYNNVLERVFVYTGADELLIKKGALQTSYQEHLERLGLISSHYEIDRHTSAPKFDNSTGKLAVSHKSIMPLGRIVLKQIGLLDKEENF